MSAFSRRYPFNAGGDGDEVGNSRRWISDPRVEDLFFYSTREELDLPVFRRILVVPSKQP